MKRGREVIISSVIILLLVMSLIPLTSASFFSDFWNKITGYSFTGGVGVNVTVSAMNIIYVSAPGLSPNTGPYSTGVNVNFTIYNGAGVSQVNDSTIAVNLTTGVAGEQNRSNLTCYRTTDVSTNYANYSCNVTMWWYDTNGTWNIYVLARDNNSNVATNTTATFTMGATTSYSFSPTNLTWPVMTAGAINETSNNDPITINNTGNIPVGQYSGNSNLTLNATNLAGETTPTWRLFANNFSVATQGNTGTCRGATGNCIECDTSAGKATPLSFAIYTNISMGNVTKGNYTINNNYTGQEQLFLCLRVADTALTAQAYSTIGNGSWVIKI
jgi:hypothetical protein